jgi:AcrR family transcriptional regulator
MVRETQKRRKQLVRQQIIDAARELLVKDGYDQLSMRRVAERIHYSPTAIYLHFKDKKELVESLCEETFSRLVRTLERLPAEHKDPVVRLRHGLERYIRFGLEHPEHYAAAFIVPHPHQGEGNDTLDPGSSGMRAFMTLRDCIADGVRAKKLRAVDPDVAARAAWGAVHGLTSLLIVHDTFPWGDRDRVVAQLIDTIVSGLRR